MSNRGKSVSSCSVKANASSYQMARISHNDRPLEPGREGSRWSEQRTTRPLKGRAGFPQTFAGVDMANERKPHGDRRRRADRRSGKDRRGGEERRSGLDRRCGEDRRCNLDRRSGGERRVRWSVAMDQRFQGALRTAETISHLFSQPLTVITGHVDLLAAETRQGEVQKKLNIIKEQLGILAAYLRSLREIEEFRTVDFAGFTLLDITSARTKEN